MQADLDNAASHIRALTNAVAKDLRRAVAVLCVGAMLVGFLIGLYYAQWLHQN